MLNLQKKIMAFWNTFFGKSGEESEIKKFCSYRNSLVSIQKSNPYKNSGPKTTFICKESYAVQPGCDEGNCVYNKGVAAVIHTTVQMSGLPTEKMSFSEYRDIMKNLQGMTDHLTERT